MASLLLVLNHYLRSRLTGTLQPEELTAALKTTEESKYLPLEAHYHARDVFGMAYSMQMKLAGAFVAAQLIAIGMLWERYNVRFRRQLLHNVLAFGESVNDDLEPW